MFSADVVAFASPVYAHSLTGLMKNFIDRISYWLHILKLTGKYGIVVSVSNSNGNVFVDDYLSKMMEFLGVSVIEKVDYSNVKPLDRQDIIETANKIKKYLINDREILNYDMKNNVFQVYKNADQNEYKNREKKAGAVMTDEILYWKNNGYFDCADFRELYDLINCKVDI